MQHKESAMLRWPAFMLFIAVAVWSELPAQIQDERNNYDKPIAKLAQLEFFFDWQTLGAVSGTWMTSGGTFNSTSATARAIATIDEYIPENEEFPEPTQIGGKFWYHARMLNQRSGSSTRVGIVYQYQDPGNFYEASFSPTGSVFVRNISNGVGTTVATGTYSGGGQNQWFDVEVAYTPAETIILVNGLPAVRGIKQDRLTQGRVGLITRQTTAKFDRLLVTAEYGDPELRESFSAGAPAWDVRRGNWSVVNGVYQNSAVQFGSITLLPIFVGVDSHRQTQSFEVSARMLNPYGGSGNRMGFVYMYQGDDSGAAYEEIVFGADGIARVNHVETWVGPDGTTNATVIPRATAPYPGARNQWFDATFSGSPSLCDGCDGGDAVNVSVNDTPVFTRLDTPNLGGPLGLVTNWTPGRFDDVWFCHLGCGAGGSVTETFDLVPPGNITQWFAARGTWDTEGGVLNNRTAAATDIVYTWPVTTNYTASVRMLNPYGNSGNRVGLIFGFDFETGDYYEVVFAPTGRAYINKFIQGQLQQVATATHSALGRNIWFDVELARRGPNATVKVNNQIVFANVPTAQLDRTNSEGGSTFSGRLGLISHWAPGRFDNLRIEYLPVVR
jgi:hypothetical protein